MCVVRVGARLQTDKTGFGNLFSSPSPNYFYHLFWIPDFFSLNNQKRERERKKLDAHFSSRIYLCSGKIKKTFYSCHGEPLPPPPPKNKTTKWRRKRRKSWLGPCYCPPPNLANEAEHWVQQVQDQWTLDERAALVYALTVVMVVL
jgi:hypothetical protein